MLGALMVAAKCLAKLFSLLPCLSQLAPSDRSIRRKSKSRHYLVETECL